MKHSSPLIEHLSKELALNQLLSQKLKQEKECLTQQNMRLLETLVSEKQQLLSSVQRAASERKVLTQNMGFHSIYLLAKLKTAPTKTVILFKFIL